MIKFQTQIGIFIIIMLLIHLNIHKPVIFINYIYVAMLKGSRFKQKSFLKKIFLVIWLDLGRGSNREPFNTLSICTYIWICIILLTDNTGQENLTFFWSLKFENFLFKLDYKASSSFVYHVKFLFYITLIKLESY